MSRFLKLSQTIWHCQLCVAQHNWQTGVKLGNLPSASLTSPGFLNIFNTRLRAYFSFFNLFHTSIE